MYISSKRLAVVEIPKCASSSLRELLPRFFDIPSNSSHITLRQYKNRYPDLLGGVAIVRHPVRRLQSAVQSCISGTITSDKILHLRKNFESQLSRGGTPTYSSLVFYPQYSFLMAPVPLRIYDIKKINSLICEIGVDAEAPTENMSRANISIEQIFSVFDLDFIRKIYSIDFILYNDVISSSGDSFFLEDAEKYFLSRGENQ
jgi:hypothetical protein